MSIKSMAGLAVARDLRVPTRADVGLEPADLAFAPPGDVTAAGGTTTPAPATTGSTTPAPATTGSTSPAPATTGSTSPAPATTGATTPAPATTGATALTSLEILAKTVPVGLLGAYTAFIATVTVLTKAEPGQPAPDPMIVLRWGGFALLVVFAAVLTYAAYRSASTAPASSTARTPRVNLLEIGAVTVTTVAWGLGTPESPLLASIPDKLWGAGIVALIVLAGVGVNLVFAAMLKTKAA